MRITGASPGRDPRVAEFPSTRWSLVLQAGPEDTPAAQAALSELCTAYWYPLYAFIRRRGHRPADAEDLTQEFLRRFLARGDFARANPERGRLRSYLLGALKHFLAREAEKAHAAKRGGGQVLLSLDRDVVEDLYQREASPEVCSPDRLYDRRWGLILLDRALGRVREEWRKRHREELFTMLEPFLTAEPHETYAEAAAALNMPESTVRVAVHRLRKRFREALRREVAQTVGSAEELEQELRDLPGLFG